MFGHRAARHEPRGLRAGASLKLTGTQPQHVNVPTSTVLDVNTYTLSAWVRYTGIQNDQTLGRWEVLEKAGAWSWFAVRLAPSQGRLTRASRSCLSETCFEKR